MDRRKVYQGQEALDDDVLFTNRFALVALGHLAMSLLGITDLAAGLAAAPGSGLHVTVGVGEVYQYLAVDPTAYGSLAPDAHLVMKQGILADAVTLSVPAPGTGGQSICYLIEGQVQQTDTDSFELPFYNSSNPTSPWVGPNNDGSASTTTRKNAAAIQVKAGTPATTGSQVPPSPDAGWCPLYVVTIANGAVSVIPANIALAPSTALLPYTLQATEAMARAAGAYFADTGAASALVITPTPAFTAYAEGMTFLVKVAADSTGATTLNVNGLGAKNILTQLGAALPAGILKAGTVVWLAYTGAAFQLTPAPPLSTFIHTLTTLGSGLIGNEEVGIYDPISGAQRKVTMADVATLINLNSDNIFFGMM